MFSNIAEKIIVACIKLRSSSRDCSQLSAMWSMWCGGAVGGQQSGEQTQQRRPWRHASHVQCCEGFWALQWRQSSTNVCDTGRRRSCVGVSPEWGAPLVSSTAECSRVVSRHSVAGLTLPTAVTRDHWLQHCSTAAVAQHAEVPGLRQLWGQTGLRPSLGVRGPLPRQGGLGWHRDSNGKYRWISVSETCTFVHNIMIAVTFACHDKQFKHKFASFKQVPYNILFPRERTSSHSICSTKHFLPWWPRRERGPPIMWTAAACHGDTLGQQQRRHSAQPGLYPGGGQRRRQWSGHARGAWTDKWLCSQTGEAERNLSFLCFLFVDWEHGGQMKKFPYLIYFH